MERGKKRYNETAHETCLCSLKHSEHTHTHKQYKFKNWVPFNYICIFFYFFSSELEEKISNRVWWLLYPFLDRKYQICFWRSCREKNANHFLNWRSSGSCAHPSNLSNLLLYFKFLRICYIDLFRWLIVFSSI